MEKLLFQELFSEALSQSDFAEYTREVNIYYQPRQIIADTNVGGLRINGVNFNFIAEPDLQENTRVMIKFDGAVPYNITSYFVATAESGPIEARNTRTKEDLVIAFMESFREATIKATKAVKDAFFAGTYEVLLSVPNKDSVALHTSSNRLATLSTHGENYSPVSHRIDLTQYYQSMFSYLFALIQDYKIYGFKDTSSLVRIGSHNYSEFAENYNQDHVAVSLNNPGDNAYFVSKDVYRVIEEYIPEFEIRTCPATGFLYTYNATESSVNRRVFPVRGLRSGYVENLYNGDFIPSALRWAYEIGYCDECGDLILEVYDYDLANRLPERLKTDYVCHDYHNSLCVACGDARSNAYHRHTSLVDFGFNTLTFNGKSYNRWIYDAGINDYDYEPYISTYGDGLRLGVEFEIDSGGDYDTAANVACCMLAYGGNEFAYAMHDGSLNDGFEIATMPATLDVHKEIDYENTFKFLVKSGYRSHDTDTCGIHVHFDRDFLGGTRQTVNTKLAYLTYILEHNWDKVKKFTRRDYHELNRWAPKKDLVQDVYADDDDEDIVNKFISKYDYDKYVAVNTQHAHSIELRIFRGTLQYKSYMAILEFVDNLVHLTKGITNITQAQQVTFADIINYKPTDYLVDYCEERGII